MIDQAEKLRAMTRSSSDVQEEQRECNEVPAKKKSTSLCQSIAIASGKGGVGKSNSTLSLAIALSHLKKRILLFDGDLGLANIHILLGIAPKYNVSHVIKGECSLENILCKGPAGITIVPGSSGIQPIAELDPIRMEIMLRDLSELENQYDYILIDGGAGIGRATIQLCIMADRTLLIITPEPTSLADAYSTAKILITKGMTKISVVVNMAESERDGVEIFKKLRNLVTTFLKVDIQLLGIIPFDKQVSKYICAQKNFFHERKNTSYAAATLGIARKLCGMQPKGKEGFFLRYFNGLLGKDRVKDG